MGVQLFRLLNDGNYESVGSFDTIEDYTDDHDSEINREKIETYFSSNKVFKGSLYMPIKTRKRFEQLFIFGWKNDMPLRRRTLIKAINDRVNKDWRRICQ